MAVDTGTTSIHVTKDDKDIMEKYGLDKKQIGKAYHKAMEEMDLLREYREEKKLELREKVAEVREEAEKLGIEEKEIF